MVRAAKCKGRRSAHTGFEHPTTYTCHACLCPWKRLTAGYCGRGTLCALRLTRPSRGAQRMWPQLPCCPSRAARSSRRWAGPCCCRSATCQMMHINVFISPLLPVRTRCEIDFFDRSILSLHPNLSIPVRSEERLDMKCCNCVLGGMQMKAALHGGTECLVRG